METVTEQPVITNDDFFCISRKLEDYHAIFFRLWEMGKPEFTEQISTAAIAFDEDGIAMQFLWNTKYWESLDEYSRLFVFCHEMLHIVLNHGVRIRDCDSKKNAGIAIDLVVNHMLVKKFGFERPRINGQENLCWVDTIFQKNEVSDDKNFEYYYVMLSDSGIEQSMKSLVDDHGSLDPQDFFDALKDLNESLSDEEKRDIEDVITEHFKTDEKNQSTIGGQKAGTGTGGIWTFAKTGRVKKKKKWETVIKNWAKTAIKMASKEKQQWIVKHRRLSLIESGNLFLPSDTEVEELDYDEDKIDVFVILDTSGSCWRLKDRFFAAAKSLDPRKFNVRLFCFDTEVKETTIESGKIYGGGGTRFDIIERHIQETMKKENIKYPSVCFLLTDGFGNRVSPQFSERWHWFLTNNGSKNYIPKRSPVFELKNYE